MAAGCQASNAITTYKLTILERGSAREHLPRSAISGL